MIKLFWNTHNQIKPKINEPNSIDAVNYKWGLYHKENSDKWIYEILNKIQFKIIENERNIENENVVIVVDSSVEKKIDFYNRLKLISSKIFLIHLGDESNVYDLSPIYDNCNYIWRTFCSNKYFNNQKVSCLPIGYKSGTCFKKQNSDRKYKWAFIGTPHKTSRHDLLFQLSSIQPSFCYKTEKFNKKIIGVDKMNEILSSSEFIPCPNGFVHPETYRLYEALECGCIPVVENAYKYYDRLFPNNPFLKIDKWRDAQNMIKKFTDKDIKKKSENCKKWWKDYKNELQNFINNTINI